MIMAEKYKPVEPVPNRDGRAIRNGDTVLASDRPTEWDNGGSSPTLAAGSFPGERDMLDGAACRKRE
jgi:hypothetical protein